MFIIDKLAYSSKLRYKNPAVKAAFAVGSLLICVGARSFVISGIILMIMGGLTVLSGRISVLRYIGLLMIPFSFLALSTLAIVFNLSEQPLNLFNIPVGSVYLVVSQNSLLEGVLLVVVALASVSCLYFLTLSTTMIDLLALLQRLRCPKLMVELMMLIYRYIFVLLDMASAISTSQKCRLGNRDFMTELRSVGQLLAVLLIRSLKKSSLLYDAMESRCYDGDIRVLNEYRPAEMRDAAGVAGYLAVMLILAVVL
ncbi:cobalt ECF transporter T component CbiQ [Anoxybacterium hadale]|uniref:Cobalt ECF transporter T component CbiQ n=1 Tax=Anoxybacterium hadale TaxID=3408580 RepID=A0ACD1AB28_9FIRM|nr:cobalt ECF transporter T component CbiQ [Clostridiales bacterium]